VTQPAVAQGVELQIVLKNATTETRTQLLNIKVGKRNDYWKGHVPWNMDIKMIIFLDILRTSFVNRPILALYLRKMSFFAS
jgi:hypothetical protein